MKTFLTLAFSHPDPLPAAFQQDDVRYPESLVEHFMLEYTQPGALVMDPFAGYGATLRVAERLGRTAFGVEINAEKAAFARSRLAHPQNLIHGDARLLSELALPLFDFSITSPPYTSKDDRDDPFSDYRSPSRGYAAYLRDLRQVYAQLLARMKPGSTLVLEIANIKRHGRLTPLAWDAAQELSKILHFEGEVVVGWDQPAYGYDHSYCLVFSNL